MYLKKKQKNVTEKQIGDSNSPQQQQLALDLDNLAPVIKEKPTSAKHSQPQQEDSSRPILGKKRNSSEVETTSDEQDVEAQIEAISDSNRQKTTIKGIPLYQEKRTNPSNEIIKELTTDLRHEELSAIAANTDFESSLDGYSEDYSGFLASYE